MKTFAALTVAALTIVALPMGCTTTGVTQEVRQAPGVGTPDATVHIKGLACPYCVYNVERSLKNVDGVKRIETDLNTGIASVWFTSKQKPDPKDLWWAVKDSGLTPSKIVMGSDTYEDF